MDFEEAWETPLVVGAVGEAAPEGSTSGAGAGVVAAERGRAGESRGGTATLREVAAVVSGVGAEEDDGPWAVAVLSMPITFNTEATICCISGGPQEPDSFGRSLRGFRPPEGGGTGIPESPVGAGGEISLFSTEAASAS